MVARIYRPSKNAMQSGYGRAKKWVLDYEPERAKVVEGVMGYRGSGDMKGQIRLTFTTKEQAVAYARRNDIAYHISEPEIRKHRPRTYADNFKFGRIGTWTH